MTMSNSTAMEASRSESERHKVWVSDVLYIPVDNAGHCEGYCAEGALGFIVQLLPISKDVESLALKIPRLMGETHRENAYISDLMDKELRAVNKVQAEGLLRAHTWKGKGPLRGPIDTRIGNTEAQVWDGSIVLVCFEKGQNPRFCLVKKENDGKSVKIHPEIKDCPVNTAKLFDHVQKCASKGSKTPWDRTVFIEAKVESHDGEKSNDTPEASSDESSLKATPNIFDKDRALQISPTGKTWYTCIPSVAYDWAPGTLQAAISLGSRGAWDINQHISLMLRLCKGLSEIHGEGMLHADLRPANIAYKDDSTKPDKYVLSDYGSFAETGARSQDKHPTGETVLGPVVGTERVSPFYAPERRAGREREAADIAVLPDSGEGATFDIVLGWRSKLLDQETSTVPIELKSVMEEFEKISANHSTANGSIENGRAPAQEETANGHSTANLLTEGDRIQIRDYIFDVVKAADIEDMQVLRCNRKWWKLYHGRIVVSDDDNTFAAQKYFPITRTVELLQWSAATDLYSLGALSLYSVYREDSVCRDKETHQLKESNLQIEESFREMLRYLENVDYFNSIWPELEWFRQQLEKKLSEYEKKSFEEFSEAKFQRQDSSTPEDDRQTLKGEATALVRRITQTVPGTYRLVEAFNFRLGPFIFFIHFVLCCLHRQSELHERQSELHKPEEGEVKPLKPLKPFCVNRLEQPSKDGGAKLAEERLEVISELLIARKTHLAALDTDDTKIPPFEPRPEPEIRVAMYNLSQQFEKTIHQFDENITSLHRRLGSAKELFDGSISSLRGGVNSAKEAKFFTPKEAIESMDTLLGQNEDIVRTAIENMDTLLSKSNKIVNEANEYMNTHVRKSKKIIMDSGTEEGNSDRDGARTE